MYFSLLEPKNTQLWGSACPDKNSGVAQNCGFCNQCCFLNCLARAPVPKALRVQTKSMRRRYQVQSMPGSETTDVMLGCLRGPAGLETLR